MDLGQVMGWYRRSTLIAPFPLLEFIIYSHLTQRMEVQPFIELEPPVYYISELF